MAPGMTITVVTQGSAASSVSALQGGWNLVSGEKSVLDAAALGSLLSRLGASAVWSMPHGLWQSFLIGSPAFLNSLQSMSPEQGYYIFK